VLSAKHFNPTRATAALIYAQAARLQQQAARGGAGIRPVELDVCENAASASPRNNPATSIKCCIDFARIDMGIKHAPLLQRWLPLHELNRTTGKQGYTHAEFDAALLRYGIKGGRAYTSRLLRKGDGIYWNLANGIIYPIGFVELSQRILNRAAAMGLHDLFLNGNNPGAHKPMYIDVSGTASDFEAAILASWHHLRGDMPISRYTLSALFNRDRRAMWRLEKIAGIKIIYNEAETTDPADVPLKDNGELRGGIYTTTDRFKRTVYHIRMANSYHTGAIRQHNRKGQGRRASYSFKLWLETVLHTNREGRGNDAPVKVNKVTRTYCKDEKGIKASRKRGNTGVMYSRYRPGRGDGVVWTVNISHDI
jgi:hypothetical protein